MTTHVFQTSTMQRFRSRKTTRGNVALTLFLAGWLNLLMQPCVMAMAAPVDDCYGFTVHNQSVLQSGSTASLRDGGKIELSMSMACESIEACADRESSYPVISGFESKQDLLAAAASLAPIRPSPVSFYLSPTNKNPVFSRVSLYILNSVFLI